MDRGHVDFERLFTLHRIGCFFVIHAKSNTKYRRRTGVATLIPRTNPVVFDAIGPLR